jgi:hypothetical protein
MRRVQHKEALRNTQRIQVVKSLGDHSLGGRRGKIKVNLMPIGSEGVDTI